jgi:hypothetical protein
MRNHFSLSPWVKRLLPVDQREQLCRILEPHREEALSRWPDNPLIVEVGEDRYELSDSIRSPGKVNVRL